MLFTLDIAAYQLPFGYEASTQDELVLVAYDSTGQPTILNSDQVTVTTVQTVVPDANGQPTEKAVQLGLTINTSFDFELLGFRLNPATDEIPDDIILIGESTNSTPEALIEFQINVVGLDQSGASVGSNVLPGYIPGTGEFGALKFRFGSELEGCMDPNGVNYDASYLNDPALPEGTDYSEENPGSCIYPVFGCTNQNALNYDSSATDDDGSCVFYNPTYTINPTEIQEPATVSTIQEITLTYDESYFTNNNINVSSHNHSINENDGFTLNSVQQNSDFEFLFNVTIPPFFNTTTSPNILIDDEVVIERDDGHVIGNTAPYFLSSNANAIEVEILEEDDIVVEVCGNSTAINYYCYGNTPFQNNNLLCPDGVPPSNFTTVNNTLCNYETTFVMNEDGDEITSDLLRFKIQDTYEGTISFFVQDLNIGSAAQMNHITGVEFIFPNGEESNVSTIGTTITKIWHGAAGVVELQFPFNSTSELNAGVDSLTDNIRQIIVTTVGDLSSQATAESYNFEGPLFQVEVVDTNQPPVFTDVDGNVITSQNISAEEAGEVDFSIYVRDPNIDSFADDLSVFNYSFNSGNVFTETIISDITFIPSTGLLKVDISGNLIDDFFTSGNPQELSFSFTDTLNSDTIDGDEVTITLPIYLTILQVFDDRPIIPPTVTVNVNATEQTLDFNLPCQAVEGDVPDFYLIIPYEINSLANMQNGTPPNYGPTIGSYFLNQDNPEYNGTTGQIEGYTWDDSTFAEVFRITNSNGDVIEINEMYDYNLENYLREIGNPQHLPGNGVYSDFNAATYDWWQHIYVITLGDVNSAVDRLEQDPNLDSYVTITYKAGLGNNILLKSSFYYTCGKYKGETDTDYSAFLNARLDDGVNHTDGFRFYAYGGGSLAPTSSDSTQDGFYPTNNQGGFDFSKVIINFQYGEYEGDFGIPGVDIYASLNESFDPYSGMDINTDLLQNTRDGFDNVDEDKRPSLGCFYYDEDNFAEDDFTFEIPGDDFIPYNKDNLVSNGDGRRIDSIIGDVEVWRPVGADNSPRYTLQNIYKPLGGWRYLNFSGRYKYEDTYGTFMDDRFVQTCEGEGETLYEGKCLQHSHYISSVVNCSDVPEQYCNPANNQEYVPVGYPNWNLFSTVYDSNNTWSPEAHTIPCSWEVPSFQEQLFGETTPQCIDSKYAGEWARWTYLNDDCYSYGTCLLMKSTSDWHQENWDVFGSTNSKKSSLNQYNRLNQAQKIIDREEATSLLNRFTSLKVKFKMKTKSMENINNPPAIEVGITKKGSPFRGNLDGVDENRGNNPHFYSTEGLYNSMYGDLNFTNSRYYSIGSRIAVQNTALDTWEEFSFTFKTPRQYLYDDGDFAHLYLITNWTNLDFPNENHGEVYLDDFEVYESYDFTPDVDVRVKFGPNNYGDASLTEYYDSTIDVDKYNQTSAPLEAQFYFYPRYPFDDIFDITNKQILHNDFRNLHFFIYNVDWGDGSPIEFTDEPEQIGENVSLYHTYKRSGIYEVTGYMLRQKRDVDNASLGVISNKRFTLRINVNEGKDEDFEYFGSESGFSFIPYKNTLPVIGGISEQSLYYKDIRRELGFIGDEKLSTFFEKDSDKLQTELALLKMDSTNENDLEILPEFQIPRYSVKDSTNDNDLIYNGIAPLRQELGKGIGDADLQNIRYFNEPLQLYELLGFEDNEAGIPDNDRYWKNIAPTFDDILDETYYYPVLPRFNQKGVFVSDELQTWNGVSKIPFGGIEFEGTWTPEDNTALITNDTDLDSLKIEIKNENFETNILKDESGNKNFGFTINDYDVRFNLETREPSKIKFTKTFKKSTKNGAF